jgi:hypothetical protein
MLPQGALRDLGLGSFTPSVLVVGSVECGPWRIVDVMPLRGMGCAVWASVGFAALRSRLFTFRRYATDDMEPGAFGPWVETLSITRVFLPTGVGNTGNLSRRVVWQ